MAQTITIDPVSRIEGHLKIEAVVDGGVVREAKSSGMMYRGLENILRVRATVGSRLNELDSLETVATDLDVQFAERVSKLQDLDYAEAISNLNLKQIQLEAAQRSFVKVSGLNLFNFL